MVRCTVFFAPSGPSRRSVCSPGSNGAFTSGVVPRMRSPSITRAAGCVVIETKPFGFFGSGAALGAAVVVAVAAIVAAGTGSRGGSGSGIARSGGDGCGGGGAFACVVIAGGDVVEIVELGRPMTTPTR